MHLQIRLPQQLLLRYVRALLGCSCLRGFVRRSVYSHDVRRGGKELRVDSRRLRWHARLRIVHRSPHLWRRRDTQRVRLPLELRGSDLRHRHEQLRPASVVRHVPFECAQVLSRLVRLLHVSVPVSGPALR